jgi:hypothetical protein
MDIDAVVLLVMMRCAQDQQAELKQMQAAQQNTAGRTTERPAKTKSASEVSYISDVTSIQL